MPEPVPVRYALANVGNCFVDGTLSEQNRAAQDTSLEGEREPLLRSQHFGRFELAQGSLELAAIEVKHRRESESKAQRERVGKPLGQR
jgi:hypothetical protein